MADSAELSIEEKLSFEKFVAKKLAYRLARQSVSNDIYSSMSYTLNMKEAKLEYANGDIYDMYLIATVSYLSDSYLWSWANSSIDTERRKELLSKNTEFKRLGEENGDDLLIGEGVEDINTKYHGHVFTEYAAEILKADFTFSYDTGSGGRMFFVLYYQNGKEYFLKPNFQINDEHIVDQLQYVISRFPVDNHLQMFLDVTSMPGVSPIVKVADKNYRLGKFTINFDELNRLAEVNYSS